MNKKIAFIFPGQGAQYLGMGKDFYESYSSAKEVFEEASDILKINFARLIFQDPEQKLLSTDFCQPAIFSVSVAILRVIQKQFPNLTPQICSGLSLGEYTGLFAAGWISFQNSLKVVASRGAYMQEACLSYKGGMSVVLGLDSDVINSLLPKEVWIANQNCPGQIVIAGLQKPLLQAEESLKKAGAKKIIHLPVSGAFHTPLMQSAQNQLRSQILEIPLYQSPIPIVMNVTGNIANDPSLIRENLISQIVKPTLWEKCVRTLNGEGITLYLEIGPGKTLSGMNKKMSLQEETFSIENISDLQQLEQYEVSTQR